LKIDKDSNHVSLTMIQPGSERKPPERRPPMPRREGEGQPQDRDRRPPPRDRGPRPAASGRPRRPAPRPRRPTAAAPQRSPAPKRPATRTTGSRSAPTTAAASPTAAQTTPRGPEAEVDASRDGRQSPVAHARRVGRVLCRQGEEGRTASSAADCGRGEGDAASRSADGAKATREHGRDAAGELILAKMGCLAPASFTHTHAVTQGGARQVTATNELPCACEFYIHARGSAGAIRQRHGLLIFFMSNLEYVYRGSSSTRQFPLQCERRC